MKHQSVESSHVKSIGHDPNTNTLEVKFKNGTTYSYQGVPADVHSEMMNSTSVGSFMNSRIKGHYQHEN